MKRFIAILVVMTIAVIVLYGVPRAYFIADLVEDQETEEIEDAATILVERAESRERAGVAVDEAMLASVLEPHDGARYVTRDGRTVTAGRLDTDPESAMIAVHPMQDGRQVIVTRNRDVVGERVEEAVLPLLFLGLGLAAAAAVAAYVLAGRATRPFRQLVDAARALGRGRFDVEVPRKGVPEALAIGDALREAGTYLDELVRREREFAVNASHQLRTPITALRLELEDLTYWEQTHPDVADQIRGSLGELDRLSAVIDDLLALARRRQEGEHQQVDLGAFVADAVHRWRSRVEAGGRTLQLRADDQVPATIPTGPVAQVLDVLIENARLHGSGTITVTTREHGDHVEVCVADQGTRTFGREVFRRGYSSRRGDGRSSGVGLAVASELAEAAGGHLTIDEQAPTTTFVLLLPAHVEEAVRS
ncbi:HAMP domain-containing sensor histidine kinase [Nocardioides sp. TF02-7]|uniref:sensor histidine kinase n=1 Tax=Nocardioides sp. TF02-7 TaxID=2917724 RepID=UPI001F069415|nr:HAMP domain-containing sensor histidine kinase [Nocardioides sp. TF02-7]UMG94285.1 HAMP domain-containing histidine kinase [Nocardioides sp. TF02-7]